ncbi:hypothetical protein FACS189449_11030 [Alphaproteobacteria bacterium]|nr:hypothetical protein FACS189449_11030 [Alphaproteobacteria bacterium]
MKQKMLDFFESAGHNSLELTFVVLHEAKSRTVEGFAEVDVKLFL